MQAGDRATAHPTTSDGPLDEVEFLGFAVLGTVVEWHSGVAWAAAPFLERHSIRVDPEDFAAEWRSLHQPAMEEVRSGRRPWVRLDILNDENLRTVLRRHGVPVDEIPEAELAHLSGVWERLEPWADAVEGLTRLKRRFSIGALSNGHLAGMMRLARHGGLPWDVIVGAEISRTYKPSPETYLRSVEAVGLVPSQVAMVSAHNDDLRAARACGLRTVFVRRPFEHGRRQTTDLDPTEPWDVEVDNLVQAAVALGC